VSDTKKTDASRQIIRLLSLFFCSVLTAAAIAVFFVNYYGPTGRYIAGNALLDPKLLKELHYNDRNPKTGGISRFVFDRIEFRYYDKKNKSVKIIQASIDQYADFFNLISREISLDKADEEMEALFNVGQKATLVILVKTEGSASEAEVGKTFQEIQFLADGSLFRVELHDESALVNWAYFSYPGIYHRSMAMFAR